MKNLVWIVIVWITATSAANAACETLDKCKAFVAQQQVQIIDLQTMLQVVMEQRDSLASKIDHDTLNAAAVQAVDLRKKGDKKK